MNKILKTFPSSNKGKFKRENKNKDHYIFAWAKHILLVSIFINILSWHLKMDKAHHTLNIHYIGDIFVFMQDLREEARVKK